MRPIDADSLKKWFQDMATHYGKFPGKNCQDRASQYLLMCEMIDKWETLDIAPVVDAKWINIKDRVPDRHGTYLGLMALPNRSNEITVVWSLDNYLISCCSCWCESCRELTIFDFP